MALAEPWLPGGWRAPVDDLWLVEFREVDLPAGVETPLHWVLRIVGVYRARWWVEEYQQAIESGATVETSPVGLTGMAF